MKKAEYSRKDIQSKAVEEILSHPLTLFAGLVGLLSVVGFFLFSVSILIWVCSLSFTLMVGSGCVNYFVRRDYFEKRQASLLHKIAEQENKNEMLKLKKGLKHCLKITNDDDFAVQGLAQFKKVQEKYKLFEEVIINKLSPTEVTFSRFLGTAEQVYFSVLDNLDKFVISIKTVDTFDIDYLEERFDKLEIKKKEDTAEQADLDEIETIQKRIDMREELLEKINIFLTENEQALTQLDKTTINLSCLETKKGRASADIKATLEDLEILAERTNKYNR